VQVGLGGMPGVITDDLETIWLDNLESEVAEGACGAPDMGGISQNGSNKYFIYGYLVGLYECWISGGVGEYYRIHL
jgi:hypothetical protein